MRGHVLPDFEEELGDANDNRPPQNFLIFLGGQGGDVPHWGGQKLAVQNNWRDEIKKFRPSAAFVLSQIDIVH